MSKDYYKILGVSRNVSKEDIRRAYRELAHKYHPDKGGEEKKFKEINEAYSVLSNDEKRQQYDQFGTTFEGFQSAPGWGFSNFSAQGGPASGWDDLFSFFGQGFEGQKGFYGRRINLEDLFSDIFGDFFTGASFSRKKSKGKNIVVDMEISFKDALRGVEREIRLDDHGIKLRVKVKVPKNLSKEEEEMIEKLKKET